MFSRFWKYLQNPRNFLSSKNKSPNSICFNATYEASSYWYMPLPTPLIEQSPVCVYTHFPFTDELCELSEELWWLGCFRALVEHDAHLTISVVHFPMLLCDVFHLALSMAAEAVPTHLLRNTHTSYSLHVVNYYHQFQVGCPDDQIIMCREMYAHWTNLICYIFHMSTDLIFY